MLGMPSMPAQTLRDLVNYAEKGIHPGTFLMFCLENQFLQAIEAADERNLASIVEIASFIHWRIPAICHGSPKAVAAWIEKHYLERAVAGAKNTSAI